MVKTKLIIVGLSILCLGGCISAVVESAHFVHDKKVRDENLAKAEAGDMEAQYKVGDSYCCSTDKTGPAYDTTLAVHWLCQSARQGYGPAMYKLGKIYSGDVIDGIRLLRRAATGLNESVVGSTLNLPVAFAWLKLADAHGQEEAKGRIEKVVRQMTSWDERHATKYVAQGTSIPCEMYEVFPNN